MSRGQAQLLELFSSLKESCPPDPTWPNGNWPTCGGFESAGFEIAVGSVLTQNTRWENVLMALERMQRAGLVSAAAVTSSSEEALTEAIRPAGFFRQKGATLRRLSACWLRWSEGKAVPGRKELLSVKGIGPETADSILLYAFGEPEFVIDAYTKRLLSRLGWIDSKARYEEVKRFFEDRLDRDRDLYQRYHALVVQHCKTRCRKKPECSGCGLIELCCYGR